MDPKATLAIINDTDQHQDDRTEAVVHLAEWLHKGGAMPCGDEGEEMHPTLTDEAVATLEEDTAGLASSLRVALSYGDFSGFVNHFG